MRKVLRWIWEFPQCLLGLILTFIYNVEYKETRGDVRIYAGKFPGGISLGLYTLMYENGYKYNTKYIKDHEYGHTIQSMYLGPLYLIVIGMPSILWAAFYRHDSKRPNKYYGFFTERWADKLGNVPRKLW